MADSVYPIPTTRLPRIIEINLDYTAGNVVFTNGTPFEFDLSSLARICRYECEQEIQIRSNLASNHFVKIVKDGLSIWDILLTNTTAINFYGTWDSDLLAFILSKTFKLRNVSFTHWDCYEPRKIIYSIWSNQIREFSMHVKRGRQTSVIEALGSLGHDFGRTINRLILVFDIPFRGDPFEGFRKDLTKVLVPYAEVILLFGGEHCCIKLLKDDGFVFDRHIRMATNDLYEPQSSKVYETYEVYQKRYGTVNWLVGSRLGKFQPRLQKATLPKTSCRLHKVPDDPLCWNTVNNGILPQKEYKKRMAMDYYDDVENLIGEENCCRMVYPVYCQENVMKWKIPGWTNTKIQKLIYNDNLTEFLTSNGFYIVLDKMDDEADFFATMTTTSRFTFICTTSHRRVIVTENLNLFLADADHIEFIGVWYSELIESIAWYFTPKLHALTMMQIEFHGNMHLIWIFNQMLDCVKENLIVFHFDARATNDRSIGSSHNALCKHSLKLEEFILVSNKWSDEKYHCKYHEHVYYCAGGILKENGSSTIVVMQDLTKEDIEKSPFLDPPFPVMVPIAYPNSGTVNGLTRLMKGYSRPRKSFSLHLVIPDESNYGSFC